MQAHQNHRETTTTCTTALLWQTSHKCGVLESLQNITIGHMLSNQILSKGNEERKKKRTFSTSSNVSSYCPPKSSTTMGAWCPLVLHGTAWIRTLALCLESCHACVIELCNLLNFLGMEEDPWPCLRATTTPEEIASTLPPDEFWNLQGGPTTLTVATAPTMVAPKTLENMEHLRILVESSKIAPAREDKGEEINITYN